MAASDKSCGSHIQLTKTEAMRVTQCTCGTLHVTLAANGITMRLSAEQFHQLAQGFALTSSVLLQKQAQVEETAPQVGTGDLGTWLGIGPKKSSN